MTEATITIEDSQVANKAIKIVHITGQLDESNVDEKIQEVYKLIESNPKGLNLIFDLENLEYMNSKSIGYLTDIYGKITESGGQVVITKPKPNITDILQVVGLSQLIKIFDSLDGAKNYLSTATANLTAQTQPASQATPTTAQTPPSPPTSPTPTATPQTPTT